MELSPGHMLGHKRSLNKFEKIEIISSIIFWPQGMKLEINYRKNTGIKHKYVETNQHATKNPMDQQRNQRENLKSTLRQMKIET